MIGIINYDPETDSTELAFIDYAHMESLTYVEIIKKREGIRLRRQTFDGKYDTTMRLNKIRLRIPTSFSLSSVDLEMIEKLVKERDNF